MSEPCHQERVIDIILDKITENNKDLKSFKEDIDIRFDRVDEKIERLNAFKFKIIGMGTLAGGLTAIIGKLLFD